MAKTTTKFTEDELKNVKDLRDGFNDVSYKLGQIEIQRANLDIEKTKLMASLSELSEKELKMAEDLKAKYGHGTIDIESGEFVPAT